MNLFRKKDKNAQTLYVLVADQNPSLEVLNLLARQSQVEVREAFTTRGLLAALSGANLVIVGSLILSEGVSREILSSTLDRAQVPVVSPEDFLQQPEDWLARGRLVHQRQVQYLPPRQVNLVNWAGGVGKTTLAMAVTRRFSRSTGLPVALLELSLGGSALHARISPDLPGFYDIATGQAKPGQWEGVDLYPMDGRSIQVLLDQEPERVQQVLADIQRQHTLFVVDAFPGHPLWPGLNPDQAHVFTIIVTSPRDDAVLQARQLKADLGRRSLVCLNMARGLADRVESGVDIFLPYKESWALSQDRRLADPLLAQVYPGWRSK